MATRTSSIRNDYRCSIELNQAGKYCVRVQVHYPRHAWKLSVFFLAASFDRGLKLDRRTEFPRKSTSVSLAPERQVPAFVLGPMRRGLAESVEVARSVAAGD